MISTARMRRIRAATHATQAAADQETAFRGYVQEVAASSSGPADELAKLADLKARGVITDAEFEAQKAKILQGVN